MQQKNYVSENFLNINFVTKKKIIQLKSKN